MTDLLPPGEPPRLTREDLFKGLWRENPVFVSALGMCPVLAVSNTAVNALTMGLATTLVLLLSNVAVSALKTVVPRDVRIVSYILIIASLVTMVDYTIEAISLDLHRALGAFISLIVVNCLILSRAEAFASKNSIPRSALDALGMGGGFTLALFCLGGVRELLGSGSLFGSRVMPQQFQPWLLMSLPSGGFFTLAIWLLAFSSVAEAKKNQSRGTQ